MQQPFGEISSFDEFPTERFKEQLETLTTSKESIDKATQFVIDNINSFNDLFDVLLNRMRKSAFSKRLSFFYLIDSICQRCSSKKNIVYKSVVGDSINEILPLILPDDNIELKQKNKVIIEKVLVIWESKNVFDEALLSKANSILAGTFKESSRLICPHLSEKEYVKLFKKMEDDRREQKKKKYEASIGQGDPLDDFIDFWCRICAAVGIPDQIKPDESDKILYDTLKQTFLLPEWTIEQIEQIKQLPDHYPHMMMMNYHNNNNNNNNTSMDEDYDPFQVQHYNHQYNNNNNSVDINNNSMDMDIENNNMNMNNNNNNNHVYSFDNQQYTRQQQMEQFQNIQQQQQQTTPPPTFTFTKSKNSKPYSPFYTTDYNLMKQYFGDKQKRYK